MSPVLFLILSFKLLVNDLTFSWHFQPFFKKSRTRNYLWTDIFVRFWKITERHFSFRCCAKWIKITYMKEIQYWRGENKQIRGRHTAWLTSVSNFSWVLADAECLIQGSFSCFIIRPVTVGSAVNDTPTQALVCECCHTCCHPCIPFPLSYPIHLQDGPGLDFSPGHSPSLSSASFPGLDPSLRSSPLNAPSSFLIPFWAYECLCTQERWNEIWQREGTVLSLLIYVYFKKESKKERHTSFLFSTGKSRYTVHVRPHKILSWLWITRAGSLPSETHLQNDGVEVVWWKEPWTWSSPTEWHPSSPRISCTTIQWSCFLLFRKESIWPVPPTSQCWAKPVRYYHLVESAVSTLECYITVDVLL